MIFDPDRHNRHSTRLICHDYSQAGAYFVTVCTRDRECRFGDVAGGEMRLNCEGEIVVDTWEWFAIQHGYIELNEWVVMPNHLHGIIVILDDWCMGGSRTASTTAGPTFNKGKPLGRLVGAFKTVSTRRINLMNDNPGVPIWQRNYYDHIIRNEQSLVRIRQYIVANPMHWEIDRENPSATCNRAGEEWEP